MISAIVVNWNGRERLPACLDALLAQQPPPDEIVLADNASDDGSRELVAERYPQVRIVDTGANGGPGRARNFGARAAAHDQLLFVDNDVILQPGALASLAATLDAHPGAGLVQARSVCADRPDVVHYDRAELHYLGMLILDNFFAPLQTAVRRESAVAGGTVSLCFLARREAYEASGGFHEELFFFFEDTEFSWRVRALGYPVLHDPDAVCIHGGGTSGLSTRGAQIPARRAYYGSRNRWLMLLTCMRWRTLLVTLPAQLVYTGVHFAFAAVGGRGWAFTRGLFAVLPMLGTVRRWRRAFQPRRVVADRDLLIAAPLTPHPGIATRGFTAAVRRGLDAFYSGYWRSTRWLCG